MSTNTTTSAVSTNTRPITVTTRSVVGIAVLGEDGDSGSDLVEAAEQARFTASARGIEVSRRVP